VLAVSGLKLRQEPPAARFMPMTCRMSSLPE